MPLIPGMAKTSIYAIQYDLRQHIPIDTTNNIQIICSNTKQGFGISREPTYSILIRTAGLHILEISKYHFCHVFVISLSLVAVMFLSFLCHPSTPPDFPCHVLGIRDPRWISINSHLLGFPLPSELRAEGQWQAPVGVVALAIIQFLFPQLPATSPLPLAVRLLSLIMKKTHNNHCY